MDLKNWALLALCSIVIVSYLFDVIAQRLRVPSVVLLILSGMVARVTLDYVGLKIPLLDVLLPIIGTLGLILIVLEGALDLSISKDNIGLIARACASSLLGLLLSGGAIASLIHFGFHIDWRIAWLYATPISVISSSVAIPAAANLAPKLREFVIYESSLSDIFGVLLFYALLRERGNFGVRAIDLTGNFIVSIGIGILAAILLYWLINRIKAHVRFIPMIAGIAFIYAASKIAHLAPLVMVLVVGLLLNNFILFKKIPVLHRMYIAEFENDLNTFKHLVAEATFVVRTFFFVLLGYSTQLIDLMHWQVWLVALVCLAATFIPRAGILYACTGGTKSLNPLLWFAPKGLITILLIISIPKEATINSFPSGTVMLLVLMSAFLLTYGIVNYRSKDHVDEPVDIPIEPPSTTTNT